jgi:hypothetical protein
LLPEHKASRNHRVRIIRRDYKSNAAQILKEQGLPVQP